MARLFATLIAGLSLVAAGLFWWHGRSVGDGAAVTARPAPRALLASSLPIADDNAMGEAPPPEATPRTREQRRFDRYDSDRDNMLTRNELLAPRVKDFKKLDTDGNNLLSFDEWAVRTEQKFDGADADHDGKLTRAEFATTAPPPKPPAKCKC